MNSSQDRCAICNTLLDAKSAYWQSTAREIAERYTGFESFAWHTCSPECARTAALVNAQEAMVQGLKTSLDYWGQFI